MDEIAAQFAALEQGARDVLLQQLTQHQTKIEAQHDVALDQAQSSGMSVSQPDLHREMFAQVTKFGGDHEKLLPKYEQSNLVSLDRNSRIVLWIRFGWISMRSESAVPELLRTN